MEFQDMTVYISHSSTTMDKSRAIALFVLRKGYLPIDPFLIFPPEVLDVLGLSDIERYELDNKIMARCNRLWVFGNSDSPGVTKEITWWSNNRIEPIEYYSWDEVTDEVPIEVPIVGFNIINNNTIVKVIENRLKNLDQRHYPKECYEGYFNYIYGLRDGLSEASQIALMVSKYPTSEIWSNCNGH